VEEIPNPWLRKLSIKRYELFLFAIQVLQMTILNFDPEKAV